MNIPTPSDKAEMQQYTKLKNEVRIHKKGSKENVEFSKNINVKNQQEDSNKNLEAVRQENKNEIALKLNNYKNKKIISPSKYDAQKLMDCISKISGELSNLKKIIESNICK